MKFYFFSLAMLIAVTSYAGDNLTLNNKMVFEGKVTKIKDCSIVFKSEGYKYKIPASDIFSIQFEDVNDRVYTKYMEASAQDDNKCMNGRLDAENYHGKEVGHVVLGFLFGPFAIIGTAIAKQTPQKGKHTPLASEHKDQFNDPAYLSCYKSKAKGKLIGMEAIGWGASIVLLLLLQ